MIALSRSLSERLNHVAVALEGAGFADNPKPSAGDIVQGLRDGGVSPLDWDIDAIGKVLGSRARKIIQAQAKSRARTILKEIHELQTQMWDVRNRLSAASRGSGRAQVVTAQVLDSGLQELLGTTVSLNFDTNNWDPARFEGNGATIFMRGPFKTMTGRQVEAPLLVKFPAGHGTVIFTSFHNEAQNSRQEEALLRYLVFSAVNAEAEALSDKTMISGGFSPTKRSLISHSSGQPSVTRTYVSPSGTPLRFALSVTGQGARLKLSLVAPTGDVYEKEAQATLVVEAAGAPAGEWRYTVTAIQVPYENFPFSVSVGEGRSSANPR